MSAEVDKREHRVRVGPRVSAAPRICRPAPTPTCEVHDFKAGWLCRYEAGHAGRHSYEDDERAWHKKQKLKASAIRPVVPTVTLREALAVLDSALEYADDRMARSTKTKIRTELAGRLERDARR